ncbi:MAG TPA: DUF2147 domain-containing protein [Devosia sp.]|jgi:uncharacterized protein (DUF2147 family)|nr:DUF2147 domain-containing protein [Devosia sp.]
MKFHKTFATLAIAFGMIAPAMAQDLSPVGTWQTASGESRYAVNYCGDGTQLCAKLTWLRKDAQTPQNLALLNKVVVNGAEQAAENKWRGTLNYQGKKVSGSVTLLGQNQMQLRGCQFIACKDIGLVRI